MIRRPVVILIVFTAFALIIWAGVHNFRVREVKKVAAAQPGQQLVLTPNGVATPDNTAGGDDAGMPPSPLLGRQAPDFKLEDTAGKEVSLASFKGRPVLVNFWATWCGPCKYEIPWLIRLQQKYKSKGFTILGVDTDSLAADTAKLSPADQAKVKDAAKTLHIDYPVLYGGDAVARVYGGVDFLPQSFYIDKSGKVVAVITGAGSEHEAEQDIQKAIGAGA